MMADSHTHTHTYIHTHRHTDTHTHTHTYTHTLKRYETEAVSKLPIYKYYYVPQCVHSRWWLLSSLTTFVLSAINVAVFTW